MSYKNLYIYQLSMDIVLEIHRLTLELPRIEHYEVGSQIRRSSKSVKSNIVEGYGRRKYQKEYLRFLIYAQASNDETMDHLETLYLTGSYTNDKKYAILKGKIDILGKQINSFIRRIDNSINNT